MKNYDIKFLEIELTKRTGKQISLRESIYSAIENALYNKIYVGENYSGIMFDIEDLTEYEKRGILDKQLNKLANKLKEQI